MTLTRLFKLPATVSSFAAAALMAVTLGASPAAEAQTQRLAFSGGPDGGTFQFFSNGIATLLSRSIQGVDVSNMASAGSVENLRRVNSRDADFGIVYSGDLYLGMNGRLTNDTNRYRNVHAVAYMFGAPAHLIVLEGSGITDVAQLAGKKVAVGPAGSGAAASAQRPEQVGVLVFGGRHEAAVGQHDVCLDQVVDRQPVLARQVAVPAAERQPGDAGGRDRARGHREPERVCRVIDIALGAARLDAHRARGRIDAHALHCREVDHQAVVAAAEAGAVMAAAADREQEAVLAREGHGGDHVGDVQSSHDHEGPLVDHAVVEGAGVVVARIAPWDQLAPQPGPQRFQGVGQHASLLAGAG